MKPTTAALSLGLALVAGAAGAHDRSSRTTPVPNKDLPSLHQSSVTGDQAFLENDKLFLWRVHWINHSEIQAGEIAKRKAPVRVRPGELDPPGRRPPERALGRKHDDEKLGRGHLRGARQRPGHLGVSIRKGRHRAGDVTVGTELEGSVQHIPSIDDDRPEPPRGVSRR